MKKTSLLSLLTAAAIVATSAGTYAVWDQMEATSNGVISVANKTVEVKTVNMDALTESNANIGDKEAVYTGTAKFTVSGVEKISKIDVKTVVSQDGTPINDTAKVEVTTTPIETPINGENAVTVTVKVKDASLAGKQLTVATTATATAADPVQ